MLITLFVEAFDKEKAIQFSSSFIKLAEIHNIKTSIVEIEDYWKFDDIYKIYLKVAEAFENHLPSFLNEIASIWMELPDVLLASRTMEYCVIHLENLEMIILTFE